LFACALGVCLVLGCKSRQQRCDEAREAAIHAWVGYTEALESARQKALTTQRDARAKLSGEIEPRLAPAAQKLADGRYDHSNSAWLRAYQSAYHEACAKDAECARLTHDSAEATTALEDLQERLVLARAAREIATGDPARAQKASQAVIVHPEYPQLKLAQQLTETTYKLCTDQTAKPQGKP
jgi:hypothetical protein